jgi:hypothetical protein
MSHRPPNFKKKEMEDQIKADWIFDCGRADLDYNLLARVLFRIAHTWTVHIDYEEYAFFAPKRGFWFIFFLK